MKLLTIALFLSLHSFALENAEPVWQGDDDVLPRCSFTCKTNGATCSITCKVGQSAVCYNYYVNNPRMECYPYCLCGGPR